ncbi:putative nucleotidyltransferase substrate binding domain-containing protein [Cribrihabitans pelagius]|uniref:putative nucleotidyltransferase substrate binding domain-containing protein n=1 Tax=Cribrihabitans pelagius TaxID=1765746 RepID=UPI003B5AE023
MPLSHSDLNRFLASVHPYDSLSPARLQALAPAFRQIEVEPGASIYQFGERLDGLYLVHAGEVEVTDENGIPVSLLGPRNSFGERGLARDGRAATSARATCASQLLMLPRADFDALKAAEPMVARFFNRSRPAPAAAPRGPGAMAATRAADMMASPAVTCPPEMTCQEAARLMQDRGISCLCVTEGGALSGILTTRDLTGKLLAQGRPHATAVAQVMTRAPQVLPPAALGADILRLMSEHGFGHVPIVEAGRLIGIVTQTDLTRFQAVSQARLLAAVARASSAKDIARATAEIPRLLVQLVAGGTRHEITTRLITDIADCATRRLLALAEQEFGPPPVPYLWLACGSQGRQEQTGVSDQDNCLILSDACAPEHAEYFEALAGFVCGGLNTCGYVYCPGGMMAVNPRWRQPLATWRGYFKGWIESPGPEAQMLASVMFDLRPIGGETSLFTGLQAEVLEAASANSIFTAHMTANSLKHTPPLGLFRGFATIRSGEHRNTLDLKHNGVVPVADLARLYALQGRLREVGTRARLTAAAAAGVLSASGARDLTDAYDLIAQTRLEHQAARIRSGTAPDNYLAPADLSDFERSHLRNAFVVVKTMQSAAGHGKSVLS